jgi:hypothetical protein
MDIPSKDNVGLAGGHEDGAVDRAGILIMESPSQEKAKPADTVPDAAAYPRQRLHDGAQCLAAALDNYLPRGWSALAVCPPDHVGVGRTHGKSCKSPGKAPWGPWKEFQTRLLTGDELRRKWRDNPLLNVGITLGGVTGLIGLDVDEKGGEELLRRLSKGDLPPTLAFTSGKGRRLLYRVPAGIDLRPTPKPGGETIEGGELRLLGTGSQTVMPPSRHEHGRLYQWVPGHGPGEIGAAVAPAWVVEFMRADGTRQGRGGKAPPAAAGGVIPLYSRNTTLCSLAGTMRRRGMTEREILAALLVVNEDRCQPPLEVDEVEDVATKIARYKPADVPDFRPPPAPARHGHAPRKSPRKHRPILLTSSVEVF